jgi:hypothetical protein
LSNDRRSPYTDEVDEERQAILNPPPKPLQTNPTDTGLVTSWPTQYDQQSTSQSEEPRKKEKALPQTAVDSQEEAQADAPDSSSSSEDEALQIEVQTQSSLDLFRKVLPGHAQGLAAETLWVDWVTAMYDAGFNAKYRGGSVVAFSNGDQTIIFQKPQPKVKVIRNNMYRTERRLSMNFGWTVDTFVHAGRKIEEEQ